MALEYIFKRLAQLAQSTHSEQPAQPAETHPFYGNPLHRGEKISVSAKGVKANRFNNRKEALNWANADWVVIDYLDGEKPNATFTLDVRTFEVGGDDRVSVFSESTGFKELEQALPKYLAGFDAAHYESLKQTLCESVKSAIVWVRGAEANAAILREANAQEIEQVEHGLYLSDQNTLLNWGSFGDLESCKFVHKTNALYPNKKFFRYRYTIDNPTIFGIRAAALNTETPSAANGANADYKSWLVTEYWADISFGGGGCADRDILKRHFTAAFGKSDNYSWQCGRVTIKLTAHEIETDRLRHSRFYRPYCRITWTLRPDLSVFYESAYTRSLQLHNKLRYIVLTGERLDIKFDYKTWIYSKNTPNALKPLMDRSDQFMFWIDEQEGVVGFGNKTQSHIIPADKFKGLKIEFSYFRDSPIMLIFWLILGENDHYELAELLGDNEKKWSAIADRITEFLPYPCERSERREYY